MLVDCNVILHLRHHRHAGMAFLEQDLLFVFAHVTPTNQVMLSSVAATSAYYMHVSLSLSFVCLSRTLTHKFQQVSRPFRLPVFKIQV